MMKSQNRSLKTEVPLRSKRLERWTRTHSPFQAPAFTWGHTLLLVLLLLTLLLVLLAPGLAADIGAIQVGPDYHPMLSSWQIGQLTRCTVAFLYVWALLGVRAMHALTAAAHMAALVYLATRISEIRITHEPFSVTWAALMLALALFAIRTITRPNEFELAEKYKAQGGDNAQ